MTEEQRQSYLTVARAYVSYQVENNRERQFDFRKVTFAQNEYFDAKREYEKEYGPWEYQGLNV